MLVGIPPFFSCERKEMYTAILKEEIRFFPHISKVARDLIQKLLMKCPNERLGSNYGFFEVKQHPFFQGIDWKKFSEKKIKPPFIPSVREINFFPEFTNIPINTGSEQIEEEKDLEKLVSFKYTEKMMNQSDRHNHSIIENRKEVENEHKDWLQNISTIPNIRMK